MYIYANLYTSIPSHIQIGIKNMIAVPSQEPDSRQLYTKIPQNTQVGIDSGNGQLKLESSNGFSLKMPSILYFPHSDVTMGDIDQLIPIS